MVTAHATVRDWQPGEGGTALRDDGRSVRLPPDCLQSSVFRFLRPGQRVRLTFTGDDVTAVGLPL